MMWPSDARLVSPGYNLAETFFGVHGNLSLGAPTIVVTHIVQGIGRVSARSLHVHHGVHVNKHSGKVSAKSARLTPVSLLLRARADRHQASHAHTSGKAELDIRFSEFPIFETRVEHWVSRPSILLYWGSQSAVVPPMCAATGHCFFFGGR